MQDWPGGLLEAHAQLAGDDGGECCFAEAGRPVQQHMIHGFAAFQRSFNGDREIFLKLRLAGKLREFRGAQRGFKLALAFQRRRRGDSSLTHVVPGYQ